jgi:hypothetical protein
MASRFTESDKLTLPTILFGGAAATVLSVYRFRQLISAHPLFTQDSSIDWVMAFHWMNTAMLFLAGVSALVVLIWFSTSRTSRRSFFILPAFIMICLVSLLGMQFLNAPTPTLASQASELGYAIGRLLGLLPWAIFAAVLLIASGMLRPQQATLPSTNTNEDQQCAI